jgi:hypothetical protein
LSARDHRDRFKNRAHQNRLQENERGKMRSGLETARQSLCGGSGPLTARTAWPPFR